MKTIRYKGELYRRVDAGGGKDPTLMRALIEAEQLIHHLDTALYQVKYAKDRLPHAGSIMPEAGKELDRVESVIKSAILELKPIYEKAKKEAR